jgi:hypothetical protein
VARPVFTSKNLLQNQLRTVFYFCSLSVCLLQSFRLHAQSYSYWTQNFNEESSLLSGAVVGGGSGPGAIYYNPAIIAAGGKSMFSFNASLFSLGFYNLKNALGNGIDLKTSKLVVQPRFISLLLQPKWNRDVSMEVAIFNNASYEVTLHHSMDRQMDILPHLPGDERYHALYRFWNRYSDDWLGIGGAWRATPDILFGLSWFGIVKSLKYEHEVDIEAMPLQDTIFDGEEAIPFYSASFMTSEAVKFNDYRMLLKLGMLYTKSRLSIGLTFKTPSFRIYSDGKKVYRKEKQSNITGESRDDFREDYVILDAQQKKAVKTNFKEPFSIAAGFKLNNHDESTTGFLTLEYYAGISPYTMVSAPVNPNITTEQIFNSMGNKEWLSFAHAAKPVINIAIGYRQKIAENLLFLAGFKTDLNYRKGVDYQSFAGYNKMKALEINVFHVTGGLRLNIRGHELITGLNYGFGYEQGRTQFINLAEPVEYNPEEGKALQGTRQNNMNVIHNSISLYFGANFSFMQQ